MSRLRKPTPNPKPLLDEHPVTIPEVHNSMVRVTHTGQPDVRSKIARDVLDSRGHRLRAGGAGLAIAKTELGEKLGGHYTKIVDRKRIKDGDSGLTSRLSTNGVTFKVAEETDWANTYWGWYGVVQSEYDMLEPYTILDTEAYYLRALKRQAALMFREGWAITGKNQTFVSYIERRLSQLGYASSMPFEQLFKDIIWNLLICSNCFVIKIRDTKGSGGRKSARNRNQIPVAGLVIMRPDMLLPFLDGYGRIIAWRRYFGSGRPYKDYDPEDVVHFYWDRKPGHLWGTPRITAVKDDILGLRRLEENYELLLVQHLFPIFHAKVGTNEKPAGTHATGQSEVEAIAIQVQTMPKEGMFVTDHRVSIDSIGAAGEAMDPGQLLEHYKQRIYTGLGVSAMDMGEADKGSSGTAEQISQNLKDVVKSDQAWISNMVSNSLFRALFEEAPFQLSVQNATSDVHIEFHEVDTDGRIKVENHALELFNNHALTHEELRGSLKRKPLDKEGHADTHFERHVLRMDRENIDRKFKHQKDIVTLQAALAPTPKGARKSAVAKAAETSTSASSPRRSNSATPANGKQPKPHKASGRAKAVHTKDRPANQHGKNLDPHKAKSSILLRLFYDRLSEYTPELNGIWDDFVDAAVIEVFGNYTNRDCEVLEPFVRDLGEQMKGIRDRDTRFAVLSAIEFPAPRGIVVKAGDVTKIVRDPDPLPDGDEAAGTDPDPGAS